MLKAHSRYLLGQHRTAIGPWNLDYTHKTTKLQFLQWMMWMSDDAATNVMEMPSQLNRRESHPQSSWKLCFCLPWMCRNLQFTSHLLDQKWCDSDCFRLGLVNLLRVLQLRQFTRELSTPKLLRAFSTALAVPYACYISIYTYKLIHIHTFSNFFGK